MPLRPREGPLKDEFCCPDKIDDRVATGPDDLDTARAAFAGALLAADGRRPPVLRVAQLGAFSAPANAGMGMGLEQNLAWYGGVRTRA